MKNKVVWACSVCSSRNYTTDNRITSSERLTVKKYCKRCNAHTVHQHTK